MPADMPASPIRPCCPRLTTLQPVKVKTNRVSARMMMMYFLTPSFFWVFFSLLSTRLYTFSLCQCQRSICPLPTQTPARGTQICLNPVYPNPPRLPSSPPFKTAIAWTQIHTYATKLMSGKPQQLQSHSHNETVTKLYPPIPPESHRILISDISAHWHMCASICCLAVKSALLRCVCVWLCQWTLNI